MWEWKLSLLVQVFKGKGDPLNSNSRRGIKLLEHVFKMYEKVLDRRLREVIDIDKMQYGFMPKRGTADAVFVLRRINEKFRAKDKKLFFIFIDLEKAFDQVSWEVIRFAMRWKGVPEYFVNGAMSLYKGVSVDDGKLSSSFSVKVGVHQWSALSPVLFIMVIDVLTENVGDGSLIQLFYAYNLVSEFMDKCGRWKTH